VAAVTRRAPWQDRDSGAVYVEFLLAVVPVFLSFLAICQLVLLSVAQLVVQHAATRAARTAIVVLEDDPEHHDQAPRGNLRMGRRAVGADQATLYASLGLGSADPLRRASTADLDPGVRLLAPGAQRGARMRPIRLSA
jgi:hypothetical protein